MSCDCTKELVEKGKAFLEYAKSVCKACEHRGKECCGCIRIQVIEGQLHKSKCPKGKW